MTAPCRGPVSVPRFKAEMCCAQLGDAVDASARRASAHHWKIARAKHRLRVRLDGVVRVRGKHQYSSVAPTRVLHPCC